jgi:hypothetical protein
MNPLNHNTFFAGWCSDELYLEYIARLFLELAMDPNILL